MEDNMSEDEPVEQIARTEIVGYVFFEVKVNCPYCNKDLYLNQHPYDEEGVSDIGVHLFGSESSPPRWHDLGLKIKCYGIECGKVFTLTKLEY
jgi:hypothetical protein